MIGRVCVSCVGVKRFVLVFSALLAVISSSFAQVAKPGFEELPMIQPLAAMTAKPMGRMAASLPLSISVSLAYRDLAGVQQFVDSVSNPKSPNYRHFISPAEVGKRFGPSPETIAKVKDYLSKQGMSVTLVGNNGLSILAETTVEQAENAFQTRILEYSAAEGYTPPSGHLYSFTSTPSLPADIQPYVIDISGLESFSHPKPHASITPNQIQTLYNLTPMYSGGSKGQGRTIAISNWDGFRLSNVPYEYSHFGLPTPTGGVGSNITVKTVSGGAGSGQEQGEGDLDIQAILGVAPLCNLVIYDGGASNLIGVLTLEANDNIADVISESYGWTLSSSTMTAAHNLHLSMNAEGITYMAASGDSGTTLNYYYPDIDPEVLLVGGTSCSVDSSGNRISEAAWSGSGGGWKPTNDSFNVLPSYQVGTGVPTNINYRLIPDVALNADPYSGYIVYLNGNYEVIGGTSGASPTFAGSLGDSEQQLITNGALVADGSGHQRLGRIQDTIYALNGDNTVFYDVTSGSTGRLPNSVVCSAGTGWDFATGWGAMDFDGFVTKLSGSGLANLSVSTSSIEGGTTTVTGTVSTITSAPSGGTAITISGGDSAVSYPTTVTIPAGARSTTFSITTSAVSSDHPETLTATLGNKTKTASVTVTTTSISSIAITPGQATGPTTFTATVTLLHAAPSGGDVVHLSGGDSSVTYPSTVTVSSGSTSATFSMTSIAVAGSDTETITGTLGSSTQSGSVTLTGLKVTGFTVSPTSVIGGTGSTGTITLSANTGASSVSVALSGGDSSVSYPSTVTVPAHATSTTFKLTTSAVTTTTTESITATLATASVTAKLSVTAPALSTFVLNPISVFGGVASAGKITLTGPAPSSGVTVALSGGDSSVSYPSTVTIASGATSASFSVTTSIVTTAVTENLKATLGTSLAASLALKPEGVVTGLSFTPSSIVGGKTATGTITLSAGAGPTGVTVALSGGDSSISYPSTVTIPSGASSKTFTVTSTALAANATEILTATLSPSSARGTLVVTAPVVTNLVFASTSVFGGVSTVGTITLSGPANSSGLTVALSGGNSSVGYPSTVSIASGASTATFTLTTSVVSVAATETIKAALGSSSMSTSVTVKPAGIIAGLSFSPATIVGGKTTTGTITLTAGAGPSGVTVTLSGGDSAITYPSSVTIPSGASSKTFTVTSSALSANATETITATLGPTSGKAVLSVTVPVVASLTFSPATVVGGHSSTGTVTLGSAAGSSGAVVSLTGGNSSVGYPSSVTVAAGATTATFTLTSSAVNSNATETLTSKLGTASSQGSVSLTAPTLSSITFSAATVASGSTSTGTITLTSAAGPAGVVIKLTGGNTAVGYPATVTVAAGATTATFTLTTNSVVATAIEKINATFVTVVKTASISVTP